MTDRCVCCGEIIPEGRQVCPICEKKAEKNRAELKPCPFCGSTDILMRDVNGLFGKSAYTRTYHYMLCNNCKSQTGYHGTKPKTIEAWNRRASDGKSV